MSRMVFRLVIAAVAAGLVLGGPKNRDRHHFMVVKNGYTVNWRERGREACIILKLKEMTREVNKMLATGNNLKEILCRYFL